MFQETRPFVNSNLFSNHYLEKLRSGGKLAIDPARREPAEALRAEFEGSVGKLPLLERIEKTDELIDAIVYRLYGLTEEEIGIVEGKAIG
jgi:hypothetical protein